MRLQCTAAARFPMLRLVAVVAFAQLLSGCAQITVASHGFKIDRVLSSAQQQHEEDNSAIIKSWGGMLSLLQGSNELNKLRTVNNFFNQKLHFDTDQIIWQKEDYWATPLETLVKRSGDCEDYAIAKYFSLKFAGVPTYKLRMIYGKAKIGGPNSNINSTHIVLAYYPTPGADPLILDNMLSEIRPLSQRHDLQPIFSFNADGVWSAASQTVILNAGQIMKWSEVFAKMKTEGFEQI